jgi:short-subunit dehydrogenase
MNFENKVCWITGASSGIGAELARQLAAKGAKLVLSARTTHKLEEVKNSLNLAQSQVLVLPMDMLLPESFEAKFEHVIQYFGRVDVLFHNAGISQRGLLLNTAFAVDKQLFEINFMNVVALTKVVLPSMVQRQSGYFVVTSSVAGLVATPMRSAYCASKHALHGYFDALRAELWPQNIGVSIICPGYIKTDISLHAVGSNGQPLGKMDKNQEQGMAVERCVYKMLAATEAQKRETYIGGKEVLGVYLKRFFPGILAKIVKKYNIETV